MVRQEIPLYQTSNAHVIGWIERPEQRSAVLVPAVELGSLLSRQHAEGLCLLTGTMSVVLPELGVAHHVGQRLVADDDVRAVRSQEVIPYGMQLAIDIVGIDQSLGIEQQRGDQLPGARTYFGCRVHRL